jgi:hypothetical protein
MVAARHEGCVYPGGGAHAFSWLDKYLAAIQRCNYLSVSLSAAFAISDQPYICAAKSYPDGMPYWFGCSTAFALQTDAMTCTITGWQWQVFMVYGPDFANWNIAQSKKTKLKQDTNTGY